MHHALGEDPSWALYRHRERLDLTDPPLVVPLRHQRSIVQRGLRTVLSTLTITAVLTADNTHTAPAAPPNLSGHAPAHTLTTATRGHTVDATAPVTGQPHGHPAVVTRHQTRETPR